MEKFRLELSESIIFVGCAHLLLEKIGNTSDTISNTRRVYHFAISTCRPHSTPMVLHPREILEQALWLGLYPFCFPPPKKVSFFSILLNAFVIFTQLCLLCSLKSASIRLLRHKSPVLLLEKRAQFAEIIASMMDILGKPYLWSRGHNLLDRYHTSQTKEVHTRLANAKANDFLFSSRVLQQYGSLIRNLK